jgi:hypothetical protein
MEVCPNINMMIPKGIIGSVTEYQMTRGIKNSGRKTLSNANF